MTDTNATTLRNALAKSIILYVHENGLKTSSAAVVCNIAVSRMHKILRGDVDGISSDYLANILGRFGYRLTGITGSGNGTEIVLSLDKDEGQVLPEIEKPFEYAEVHGGEAHVDCREAFGRSGDFESDPDANRVVADE